MSVVGDVLGMLGIDFLMPQPEHVKGQVHEKVPDSLNSNLHYGQCPKDRTYLRKKGRMAFCGRCGYKVSRALLLARKA